MIKPEREDTVVGLTKINSQRLYGCQSNVVYSRSQLIEGITLYNGDIIVSLKLFIDYDARDVFVLSQVFLL